MSDSDFDIFAARVFNNKSADPGRVVQAGRQLIDGALHIRRGGNGIYGEPGRPVTKPAEAIGAWLDSLEAEAATGLPFRRPAEAREALIAAAEEVESASQSMPRAARYRSALFSDALDTVGWSTPRIGTALPWIISGILGGILIGLLIRKR